MSNRSDGAVKRNGLLACVGPGLLVAATGVGAGDLATAALTGSRLGVTVLWAVLVGALLKYALTEGLARFQLATGETLLAGARRRLGLVAILVFLPFLLFWSWFVGAALMGACGAALHAIVPLFDDAATGKWVWGAGQGLLGIVLVLRGGFQLFERVMSVCIGVMFVTVCVTAVALGPDPQELVRGLVPSAASLQGEALGWTVALMGGVGGTVTILCYGYWIREQGRQGPGDLALSRLDLSLGYVMTAVFGLAMVTIGSGVTVTGSGAGLIVSLADRLEEPLGAGGRILFLAGAWGAVFSSLLGVWQAVPYLFADAWRLLPSRGGNGDAEVSTRSWPYRGYLFLLAFGSMPGLAWGFGRMQKWYAVVGASFLPLVALALLFLNRRRHVGERLASRLTTQLVLAACLGFFLWLLIRRLA